MRKLWKLGVALAVLAFVFAGCPTDEPEETKKKDPEGATGISLRVANSAAGTPSTAQPGSLRVGNTLYFSAAVQGTGTFDATYTITVTPASPDMVTIGDIADPVGKSVEAIAGPGSFQVTATGTQKRINGTDNTASWTVTIPDPTVVDFSTAGWKVLNLSSVPNAQTTTELKANADKRYVIFNNEANAMIDNGAALVASGQTAHQTYMRGSTIAYIDQPIVADLEDFKAYGIEARVRITGDRDTNPVFSNRSNVVLGAFTDPTEIGTLEFSSGAWEAVLNNPEKAPSFVGLRKQSNADTRAYLTRLENSATRNYGGITANPNSGSASPTIPGTTTAWNSQVAAATGPTKIEHFREQEFVYRIMRNAVGAWVMYIMDVQANLIYWFNIGTSGTNETHPDLIGNKPLYLGIIVTGVEAEFSDIKVYYDLDPSADLSAFGGALTPAWVDPAVANATPYVQSAIRIDIIPSAASTIPGNTADYSILANDFPPAGISLSATVIPRTMSQAVTWALASGTSVSVQNQLGNGMVTRNGTNLGLSTVTATANQGSGGQIGSFTFDLVGATTNVDSVAIAGSGQTQFTAVGENYTYIAEITPPTTPTNLTWKVSTSSASPDSATSLATISAGGELTVVSLPATDTKLYVYVTTTVDSKTSSPLEITVKAAGGGPVPPQIWRSDIGLEQTPNSTTIAGVGAAATLTIKGSGQLSSANSQWNFVYLKATADDFTMTVKVNEVTWNGSANTGRIGIMAIPQAGTTQNPQTGSLSGVPEGNLLASQSVSQRGDNSYGCAARPVGAAVDWDAMASSVGSPYMRLRKVGTTYYAAFSPDGTTWTDRTTRHVIDMSDSYIGLFVGNSQNSGATRTDTTAVFSEWRFISGTGMGADTVTASQLDPVDFAWLTSDAPGPGGPYYLWEAGTAVTFANATTAVLVGDKHWIHKSGPIGTALNVTTAGIELGGTSGMRLIIGASDGTDSTASTAPEGQFDFSTKRKVTIEYTGAEDLGGNFMFYINNNTTSQGNSPLGNPCRLRTGTLTAGTPAMLVPAGKLELIVDPTTLSNHASLAKAFIMIRTDGTAPKMTITKIMIEDTN